MFDGEASRLGAIQRYWLVTTEGPEFSGGIGVYTHQSACMMAARGVAVTVLHHDPEADEPAFGFHDGYRHIRFSGRGLDRRPIPHANLHGPLRIAREAGELVRMLSAAEGRPDVVEFQDYGALAWGFLKHRLMNSESEWPKVVLTAHRPNLHCVVTDGDSPHEHRTAFLGQMERWCFAAADAVLAPCRFIVDPLAAMGFPMQRAQVICNPYDPATVETVTPSAVLAPEVVELERALHTASEPVLFLGKLQGQKGASDLLAALSALHTEHEAPPLWMFGRDAFLSGSPTTTYDAMTRRHARLFHAGGVRYFGGYGLADLKALCARQPVCALPYREDCLPYAFIEAVLCGAIPLTSASGGQAELIPPDLRDFLTADVTRPDAWAAKLRCLLALSAAERRQLSRGLQASVTARTDPDAVFRAKMAALQAVTPTYRVADYPFVHAEAVRYGPADPQRRKALAAAAPQRGTTRTVRRAGLPPASSPDLVSVIVPYHEMQAYLDDTLASIEAQDHQQVEVIVVDDGSPSTAARSKLDAVLAAPRRFPTRVIRKTNGGLADARNAGAKAADGAYLYFLDADDLIDPSLLSRSLRVLRRFPNVAYVGAGLQEFGEGHAEWSVFDIDGPYIGFHNLQICAFLVRAEAWLEHGLNDPAMTLGMEDYESHLRMFAAGVRGVALPETLFHYRKRPGSMSKAFEPHGVAQLYRRAWSASPELLRHYGPELVGLYAENGHGALAPSACEASPAHAALFARDIPDQGEIADGLEEHASRERLGRALRGRCWDGGPEWDYTVARLLLALDREPAFARQLLRSAVERRPDNDWFRFYAMVAELRDGRLRAAEALWTQPLAEFCEAEAGAVAWIAALEAVRGLPHVAVALGSWIRSRTDGEIGATPLHLGASEEPCGGDFAALHAALEDLRSASGDPKWRLAAVDAVHAAAAPLSREATDALVHRWNLTWRSAGLLQDCGSSPNSRTYWGRTADAYVGPRMHRTPAPSSAEAAERERWSRLSPSLVLPKPQSVIALGRRLRRRPFLAAAE